MTSESSNPTLGEQVVEALLARGELPGTAIRDMSAAHSSEIAKLRQIGLVEVSRREGQRKWYRCTRQPRKGQTITQLIDECRAESRGQLPKAPPRGREPVTWEEEGEQLHGWLVDFTQMPVKEGKQYLQTPAAIVVDQDGLFVTVPLGTLRLQRGGDSQ